MYFCYTDGGCRVSERNPGGWGVFIKADKPQIEPIEKFGWALDTSSSIMELTAVKAALEILPPNAKATLFSDSLEALSLCEKSIPKWRENGWKNTPKDLDKLLRDINDLILEKNLKMTWSWIKSHNGNPGNERADALADQGAREAKRLIPKKY
jgi:ribonuclease HI